jgi:hypothetical protein
MIWWLKARLVHPLLTGGLLAFTLLSLVFQDGTILLPAVSINAGNTVLLTTFTPIIVAAVLVRCLDARLPSAEMTGMRAIPWMDSGLIIATLAVAVGAAWVGGELLNSTGVYLAGRNALFMTGLMLCARSIVGRASIVVPTAWIFIVIFLGHRTATAYYPWAITGLGIESRLAATAATAAFLLGTGLNQRLTRNKP